MFFSCMCTWFLFSVMAREKFGVDREGTSGALEDCSVQVGKYGRDQGSSNRNSIN